MQSLASIQPNVLEELQHRVEWLESVLLAYGISGPWLSPAKAAKILGFSRDKIIDEIHAAEKARATGKRSDLIYGTHYRNIASPESMEPTWQVNVTQFSKVVGGTPPESRK